MKPINESAAFRIFTSSDCNRRDFIVESLERRGIKAVVMPIDGKEHIYVVFPQEMYNPLFAIKTVIAHYDRFTGSPGANDNSSSVFALMDFAERLMNFKGQHNIRMIFTDGEELTDAHDGVSSQGAFALASLFRRLGITNEEVYVFDCMGRGSVPVMGSGTIPNAAPSALKRRFTELKERTAALLKDAAGGKFLQLPVGYSDNAGFLAAGIPAVAVTMLPDKEAEEYMTNLMKNPALQTFVTNKTVAPGTTKEALSALLPKTWQLFHTEGDNAASLTPESFSVTAAILDKLAKIKTMAER
ncbi:MAG: M28 family peptidase [Treponema sp.]